MQAMLAKLGWLATQASPTLQHVLGNYGLQLTALSKTLIVMLNLELFVLSYQTINNRAPSLSIDWWGRALQFLSFAELALSLGELSEKKSRVHALLKTQPNGYHLIRFGFQGGREELYSHA
jgi:hypothetical protein